jgi:hypothetical protein
LLRTKKPRALLGAALTTMDAAELDSLAPPAVCSTAMRCQIQFIRLAPHQGELVIVETITIEAASLREAEARAFALFEDINVSQMADGFRIMQDRNRGEVLRWIRGDVQAP